MSEKKRYALVGTGSRASMFIDAITLTYTDVAELVAFSDLSQTRMDWYNENVMVKRGFAPLPTYPSADFDRMIEETKPDVVIVTTMDATHHIYITRAMELGCDVITEKPMTTDIDKLHAIYDTIERTGRSLRVTFNYRYAPAYTRYRELIMQGVIGKPLAVDFSWILDTSHGADYFRRWHREKQNSGGLLVHKATHHFDLVNWWIDSYPVQVFAMGGLQFYGQENAEERGEHYSYKRYTGEPEAKDDPFALFLDEKEVFRGLYMNAEKETGYLRDRNVFGEPITAEDTMNVTVRYQNGVLMSYCLIAYAPWEGLKIAITGTKGRIEMEIVENINHLNGDGAAKASKGAFKTATIRVYPMFGESYEVDVPMGDGGHGGADPIMLEQIFSPNPPDDPFTRAATHIDGAASILVGISGNIAMQTGQLVNIPDLFELPQRQASSTSATPQGK
ncbi:Gfo/Idh/MocA family oxidoreductase [Phototrophicus methaneseepsis]|uniref:Gfo/Idh/MocA family oxidoreductase n=1 Tax=Phototrophicus methaneseepsis TaxID=2710758 RepID=A0A7S8EBU5_9CHLR|nr:Gfo/Idh/MocA family oxidoreductase [Phototrophicus methaneseepsis]QPC84115.1 Gfo/Idh/MocA family oxidoreductase [Phototrophicus methaneseepsis]